MRDQALVLFSGGQDSTTCLAWALASFARVETVGFRYGQRHAVELECRPVIIAELKRRFPAWGARLGEDRVIDLDVIAQLGATAMTADIAIRMTDSGLPNTFVPGRNLLFFTAAAACAYRRGIRTLVGGMCETDFSGYPDCRDDALKALQVALGLGMDTRFTIETPLMWIDKGETFALAEELGGKPLLEIIAEHTHTCYLGSRERHDWGPGCGVCPACKLRRDGWARYLSSKAERRSA
ncbi:MAG TPA: 7-cyano-7-deazaguanine synthase QueC [Burkholderiales bacterium]|nr:7-cyano-7-deazaguanine synthase QueC [Burkholderiales bacterium]HUK04912.1 7-cyano-7-deazaguanine synthase QueC [Burkholderiales bacterium]